MWFASIWVYTLGLPTTSETLWSSLKSKVRAQVRRPGKEGFQARIATMDELPTFYRVLARRWHQLGSPILPQRFFRELSLLEGHPMHIVMVEDGASIGAFWFGAMPDELTGTADAVFFVRMLHNVWRFQSAGKGDYLDMALKDAFNALKPGGILGVVQHHARDDKSDDWANGSHGYMKKQFVVDRVTAAGFEFVAESDINANEKDQPGEDDIVWRLPPTYATSRDNEELKAQYAAIGESNRMTLKFRRPE